MPTMLKQTLILILPLLVFFKVTHAAKKQIVLCVDNYPPAEMHLSPNNQLHGFAADIINHIYTANGFKVIYFDAPYSRGVKLTQTGVCDVLAQVVSNSEDALLYPKVALLSYHNAYFIRNNSDWIYSGVPSLKGLRVGDVSGFDYSDDPEMDIFMKDNSNNIITLYGDDAIERSLIMIVNQRIDTINLNTMVGQYYINKLGIERSIKIAPVAPHTSFMTEFELVPGFSLKSPYAEELRRIWDADRPKLASIADYISVYGVKP